MKIIVKTTFNRIFEVEIEQFETVLALRAKIDQQLSGSSIGKIIFAGFQLKDKMLLGDCGLQNGSVVMLVRRLSC